MINPHIFIVNYYLLQDAKVTTCFLVIIYLTYPEQFISFWPIFVAFMDYLAYISFLRIAVLMKQSFPSPILAALVENLNG